MEIFYRVRKVLVNPRHSRWVAPCLVLGEALLGSLIIWKIPYTEIDWTTYMQQVRIYLDGERDYSLIKGDTGLLVYPAIHLHIYSWLYHLTDGGTNILFAQLLFLGLYLFTLAIVIACYRKIQAPPWLFIPLVLSKRLHSIFLLRLFNDAWATLGFWLAIYFLQRRRWLIGALFWSCGLGVKMTILVTVPALGMIILQTTQLKGAVAIALAAVQVQLLTALPFTSKGTGWQYLTGAFNFGRQFLYKWTVNWRFIRETTFVDRRFSLSLLVAHVSILLIFLHTRWVKPSSWGLPAFARKYTNGITAGSQKAISSQISPVFVMDSLLGSMAVGLLCARSLHYQFYAYLAWATPYLLWRSGFGPIWVLTNCLLQEIAWLTYPSTELSSGIVVVELLFSVFSVWIGSGDSSRPAPKSVEHP